MNIALFDTINHPTPILREWAIGFLDLGHKVKYYPIEYNTIISCADEEFDLIVYVGKMIESEFEYVRKKFSNTKIVCATDVAHEYYKNFTGLIDFFITTRHSSRTLEKNMKSLGFKIYNIPLAGNDRLFYPTNIQKEYDLCFIGTLAHGYRKEDKYLYPFLDNSKYNTFLAGMTYKNKGIQHLPYEKSNFIRNKSKININFHFDFQIDGLGEEKDRIDLNQSVYNIALSGGFQICDHPLVKEVFQDSIVVANEKNWIEVVDHYINTPQEREHFSQRSYEIALKEHTWKIRMKQFLSMLEENNKNA